MKYFEDKNVARYCFELEIVCNEFVLCLSYLFLVCNEWLFTGVSNVQPNELAAQDPSINS